MNYKIYINAINSWPVGDWGVSAYEGWRARGSDIIFFEDIDEVPVSPYNIVVADIDNTNKYFKKLGLPPKMAINVPEEIESYCGRWILRWDMETLRKTTLKVFPCFVKGDGLAKRFVPGVVKDRESLDTWFHEVLDTEPILTSEVVDFVSEYRVYIVNKIIKGIKWYHGDFFIFPSGDIIKEAVAAYTTAPAGYTMDFGVTNDGKTLLIECNDGWSIGNYGLEPSIYVSLLAARWLELMRERC